MIIAKRQAKFKEPRREYFNNGFPVYAFFIQSRSFAVNL